MKRLQLSAPQFSTRGVLSLFIAFGAVLITLTGCARLAPPEPQQTLYLRGEFNNWFSDQDRFVIHENNHLVVNKTLSAGQYQFLISDRAGSCQASLGDLASSPSRTLRSVYSDAVVSLTPCQNSATWSQQNNSMTLVVPETATYHFTLKTDSQPPRLVIVKSQSAG